MLCFRCGSHNPDGSEFCSQCGQKFGEKKKAPEAADTKPPEIKIPEKSEEGEDSGLKPGDYVIDRYEISAAIGAGPLGMVYRAHDMEIDVDVALKLIHQNLLKSREDRNKFLAHIRNARKINHTSVVRVYDEDQDGDTLFFTMQLLEGLSLRKIVNLRREKEQVFLPKEMDPIFSHICQALEVAHESMVHGNLKPENVIILPNMLKVTDFGLMGALPLKEFVAAQEKGQTGYPYLAPELRDESKEILPAADIYSLGVMLCEMVTTEVYAGPESGLPRLSDEAEVWLPLLNRALNENPQRRHRSPRDFYEEFRAISSAEERATRSLAPSASELVKEEAKQEPAGEKPPAPPAVPGRRKVGFGAKVPADDPPTVVDATIVPDEVDIPDEDEDEIEPVDEIGVIEKIADDLEAEEAGDEHGTAPEIDEPGEPEPVDDEAIEEEEAISDAPEIEDGDTWKTPIEVPDELRVAHPMSDYEKTPSPSAGPAWPEDIPSKAPRPTQSGGHVPIQDSGHGQPTHGSFSQPPFPPQYSQLPVPRPTRAPLYVFLVIILVAVSVGTYFLVDYLRAQTELIRAQAQAANDTKADAPAMADASAAKTRKPVEPPKAVPVVKKEAEPKKVEKPAAAKEPTPAEAEKPKIEPPAKEPKAAEVKKAAVAEESKAEKARKAKADAARKEEERKRLEKRRKERERRMAEERGKKPKPEPEPIAKKPEPKEPAKETVKPPPPEEKPPVTPAPKEVAAAAAGTIKCPRGMVTVPAGTAYIGSATNDPMRNFGEIKLHPVEKGAFCIDRYEYPNAKGRKPRINVSWTLAKQLCRKRGKRLCSEDEWEYACKGKGNRRFPYGNKWDAAACNTEDAKAEDRTVTNAGSFPKCRSPFGVFDLSGNVSEWTDDKYSPAAGARTYKGGSATRPNWATRCASRSSLSPGTRKPDVGFRCCANPK